MKILNYSASGKLLGVTRTKKRRLPRQVAEPIEVPRESVWTRKYPDEEEGWVIKKRYRKQTEEQPFRGERFVPRAKLDGKKEEKGNKHGVYVPTIPGMQKITAKPKKQNGKVVVKTFGAIVFRKLRGNKRKFVKRPKTMKG